MDFKRQNGLNLNFFPKISSKNEFRAKNLVYHGEMPYASDGAALPDRRFMRSELFL
jgi:hypothetical protein